VLQFTCLITWTWNVGFLTLALRFMQYKHCLVIQIKCDLILSKILDTGLQRFHRWICLEWFSNKTSQNCNTDDAAHRILCAGYLVPLEIIDDLLTCTFSAAVYMSYHAIAVYSNVNCGFHPYQIWTVPCDTNKSWLNSFNNPWHGISNDTRMKLSAMICW
jgi:hypothetical protein